MQEYRCIKCHSLLFLAKLEHGSIIEIKCKKCKKINRYAKDMLTGQSTKGGAVKEFKNGYHN